MSMFWKIFLFSVVIFALYSVAKIYVLSKLKVSKWIVLGLAIFFFVFSAMPILNNNEILTITKSGIFIFFFLWFFDLASGSMDKMNKASKGNKNIKIRPKAKPNRVKHLASTESNKK